MIKELDEQEKRILSSIIEGCLGSEVNPFRGTCRACGSTKFEPIRQYPASPFPDEEVWRGRCKECGKEDIIYRKRPPNIDFDQ